ncbi:MAG: efflux transporter outer membrane subunit [Ferrovum sp.]|nr:efflux transporter outer membrane subunit [Ferrovum sp.]
MTRYCLPVMAIALLTGCVNLAPTYERPVSPVSNNWPTGPAYPAGATSQGEASIDWQSFILDPKLRQLVTLALNNNRDLRVAALTIEKVQAQYQIEQAALFPHINATGGDNASRTPPNVFYQGSPTFFNHYYNVGVGFSAYELDFFGRISNLRNDALEQYLSTEEARRSTLISLVAEIASTYLTLAADQGHLALAEDTLKNQQTAFALDKRRFELGATSQLDLSQAQTAIDTARGDVARYTGVVAQDINALTLLAGTSIPGDLLPTATLVNITAIRNLPPGLPSEVLQNRPDVLEAEHKLKAANADIGVARAAFFPSITLTATTGTASDQLSGLFTANARAWSFSPQLNLPIFDAGNNAANLKVSEANRNILLAQYEKAIQNAFREVADALANQGTLHTQIDAQQSLVDATALSFRLADARFQHGVDSYLTVLDSQRSLYAAQQNLINLKLANAANQVTLYKALGGSATTEKGAGAMSSEN